MSETMNMYMCATCRRCYVDEAGIRAHQDLRSRLHAHDPLIEEHDGQPWERLSVSVGHRGRLGRWKWCVIARTEVLDGERNWVEVSGEHQCLLTSTALADAASGTVPATPDEVRAFAAAIAIDDQAEEVDVLQHIRERRRFWSDHPARFAVEMIGLQALIGLTRRMAAAP